MSLGGRIARLRRTKPRRGMSFGRHVQPHPGPKARLVECYIFGLTVNTRVCPSNIDSLFTISSWHNGRYQGHLLGRHPFLGNHGYNVPESPACKSCRQPVNVVWTIGEGHGEGVVVPAPVFVLRSTTRTQNRPDLPAQQHKELQRRSRVACG